MFSIDPWADLFNRSPIFGGIKLVGDRFLTETVRVEHDKDRFIEYGPDDESWRRYFGFVTLEQLPSRKVYRIGDTWIMHPDLIERIKKSGAGVRLQPLPNGRESAGG